MTRLEQDKAMAPQLKTKMTKSKIFDNILYHAVQFTDGNPQRLNTIISEISELIEDSSVRPWVVGMTTNPGDLISNNSGKRIYMFIGSESMVHQNSSQSPGSNNVNYWFLVKIL